MEPKKDDLQLSNYDPSVRLLRNGKKRFVGKSILATTASTTKSRSSKATIMTNDGANSSCSSDSSLSITTKQNVKIDSNNNNKKIKNKNIYKTSSVHSSSSMDSVRTNQRQSSLSPTLSESSHYSSSLSNNNR